MHLISKCTEVLLYCTLGFWNFSIISSVAPMLYRLSVYRLYRPKKWYRLSAILQNENWQSKCNIFTGKLAI